MKIIGIVRGRRSRHATPMTLIAIITVQVHVSQSVSRRQAETAEAEPDREPTMTFVNEYDIQMQIARGFSYKNRFAVCAFVCYDTIGKQLGFELPYVPIIRFRLRKMCQGGIIDWN